MDRHFLNSYVLLLIETCHRRRIHAMGGMAAQIPIKDDPAANEAALEKVRQDKLREVRAGHRWDLGGAPGWCRVAKEIFDADMKTPNQISRRLDGLRISSSDLLQVPEGEITEAGLRWNIDVGLRYLAAWLKGNGCVPIYNLMEDQTAIAGPDGTFTISNLTPGHYQLTASQRGFANSSVAAVQLASGQALELSLTLGPPVEPGGFFSTVLGARTPTIGKGPASSGPEPPRRGLPSPLNSPPFPNSDWSYGGAPDIGAPDTNVPPLMTALYAGARTPKLGRIVTSKFTAGSKAA